MKQLTEHSLGIFWLVEEIDKSGSLLKYHQETDGIMMYGYWIGYLPDALSFPYALWPKGTLVKDHLLTGDNWTILEWVIRIIEWPARDMWQSILMKTLDVMCTNGAQIAWCGVEGHFADPPRLFDPEYMQGVYAYLAPGIGFVCSAQLGCPMEYLDSKQLTRLRSIIKQ